MPVLFVNRPQQWYESRWIDCNNLANANGYFTDVESYAEDLEIQYDTLQSDNNRLHTELQNALDTIDELRSNDNPQSQVEENPFNFPNE